MALFQRRRPSRSTATPRKVTHPILYERPYRIPVALALFSVVAWNCIMLGLAIAAARITVFPDSQDDESGPIAQYQAPDVLFWVTIPIVVWLVSLVDLHQRWRRALSPLHIVISSSFGLLLWVVAGGIWFPCTNTSVDFYADDNGASYCPLANGYAPNSGEPYLVPFIAIGAVVCYLAYFILGLMTLCSRRTLWRQSEEYEVDAREGYKITSSIYTNDYAVSESLPSTLPGDRMSGTDVACTTRPPSYVTRGTSQRAHSHTSDRKYRLSGVEGCCDCQCHHHPTNSTV